MRIVIHGQVRPKKNSKQIVYNPRTKRRFVVSSATYNKWHKDALWQLKGIGHVEGYPIAIDMVFYAESKRKFDLDNLSASILDTLQDANIIEDDDCYHIGKVTLRFGGVDKHNPRAEITIAPLLNQ